VKSSIKLISLSTFYFKHKHQLIVKMATVARENIGLLNDKIVIKISAADYLPVFEKKIKEYTKTMNVPGFRKGMVPAGIVKKMYGASIYTDEVLKTVEKELYTYLQTENPDIFAQPMALESNTAKLDFNKPEDYEFGFEIGLKPTFELPALGTAALTLHKVTVTDEMLQEELDNLLKKAGKLTEPETIELPDTMLNIVFTASTEDGSIAAGVEGKQQSLLLSHFSDDAQAILKGKKKGDQVVVQLTKALQGSQLQMVAKDAQIDLDNEAAANAFFQLTIEKISIVEAAELNEELFEKVFPGSAIATTEEFKAKLKEDIEKAWLGQSRNQLHDQLYHFLLDNTQMEFPNTFLKRWLQVGGEKQKSVEEVEAEFPTFTNQLKWTLISDKLVKDNALDVTPDELKASMRAEIMQYFGGASLGDDTSWLDSYVDRMMKDEKHVDSSYRKLLTDKLFQWVETQVTPVEKAISADDFTTMVNNHHH
jgi:trigger factor